MRLPTQGAVHEVAGEVNPEARVVDVDTTRSWSPMAGPARGQRPEHHGAGGLAPPGLLARPEVRAHMDFSRPLAIGLLAVLHFLFDADDPAGLWRAFGMLWRPGVT